MLETLGAIIIRQLRNRGVGFAAASWIGMTTWAFTTLAVSAVVTRFVDEPAMRMGRRLEQWAFA